jgi:galactose mutarotase-like enzyme
MSRHGFARGKSFDLLESSSDSASFRLTSDSSTLKVYPFRFELDTLFKLKGAELSVTATVRNLGDEALPASVGFHPALRWPLPFGKPRAAHFIEFSNEEPAPIRRLDAQGLLTPTPCSSPVHGRRLALDDALFVEDVVIFDRLRSRAVTYGAGDGPRIRMSFADAAFLGIWTKPKAPFICIEPWRGVADPQGFSGDFRDKPGVFELARGESTSLTMTIALLSA